MKLPKEENPVKIQNIPSIVLCSALFTSSIALGQALDVARYDASGQLLYPTDTVAWIHVGSVLGGQYSEEPFDPAQPGDIGVVQMEPSAYAHFREHGSYADGTMFLLTFYDSEAKSQPQLQGFVQGEMRLREIHVIDKVRFAEGRAFFQFQGKEVMEAAKIPDGSPCTSCHEAEGALDGTFTQFYPTLLAD